MINFKNNREEYVPDRGGKDERSRIEWFLFVHELLKRFESGKISKKEEQLISLWVPLSEGDLSVLPNEKDEKDAKIKIYRKISEHFSTIRTNDNEPIPVQPGKSVKPTILGNFPVIMIIIFVTGIGMFMVFNKKNLFPQRASDTPSVVNVIFSTGDGEYKQFILPDGTSVHLSSNTVISFCADEFNKTTREVELMQGEAFFETVETNNKPFVVQSKTGSAIMKSPAFKIRVAETGAVEIIPKNY